jgi:hypothetical protein
VHGRGAAFGVHHPFRRVAAEGFGELSGPSASKIAEPAFAPRGRSSSLSTASTLPHSSFKPSVRSGPSSPFSQASKATPAPQAKWLHSMPKLLMRSAR